MAELKYGGSDVKIMYGSQEIGGSQKLENGTILAQFGTNEDVTNIHLKNTSNDLSNVNRIRIVFDGKGQTSYGVKDGYYSIILSHDDIGKTLDWELPSNTSIKGTLGIKKYNESYGFFVTGVTLFGITIYAID